MAAKDNKDRTLLHYSLKHGGSQLIPLLLEKGVDIEARDNKGCTPLFYAFKYYEVKSAKLLIKEGANVTTKDNKGCSLLDCVKPILRESAAQILQKACSTQI